MTIKLHATTENKEKSTRIKMINMPPSTLARMLGDTVYAGDIVYRTPDKNCIEVMDLMGDINTSWTEQSGAINDLLVELLPPDEIVTLRLSNTE